VLHRWRYLEEEDGIRVADLHALAYLEEEDGGYGNPNEGAPRTTVRKTATAAGTTARTAVGRRARRARCWDAFATARSAGAALGQWPWKVPPAASSRDEREWRAVSSARRREVCGVWQLRPSFFFW
jgi:hypothetical protein